MRSAGCAINDFADRGFDRFVERTKGRPLVDGRLDKRKPSLSLQSSLFLRFRSCFFECLYDSPFVSSDTIGNYLSFC